ncbi:MAG: pyridoxamine 5'-phosphate oxidase family protein [Sulfurimonas sp.]|uniref:pyridoxamine 5'-phosphate oxidase family protein n=1 Tax=Sulfurimonas sp. TaxID=2022749 RepID=UPI002623DD59|nr:pyridoxamine 5'-phosphate oxidase family protein [Sulfurimonas sp.]MCW8896006.1 pyridoxamine 5'-phosphate oxidase family protein [Sulfurimonas sp.]MCW8954165.1 pyridoxamine 5'-phosphate oxidase family protein [Sulfurimonas sp.]MCW9066986.1 pyridoxamine 5'-phosphate oxidase family protein [Sulfurimonas sp.]
MKSDLDKIETFLNKHHVLSLATSTADELSSCSLFYAFDKSKISFVVASSDDTTHIQHILKNSSVAGTVILETKTVGKIQGVQFRGEVSVLDEKNLESLYFKKFPQALLMSPKLWLIKVDYFKMTDNTLGFGKKIIWQRS